MDIIDFRPAGNHDWAQFAQCAKPGAANMFPSDSDNRGIRDAKSECRTCPVRLQCLAEAFERDEKFGVWGGLTTGERNSLRRRLDRRASLEAAPKMTAAEKADHTALDMASRRLDGAA